MAYTLLVYALFNALLTVGAMPPSHYHSLDVDAERQADGYVLLGVVLGVTVGCIVAIFGTLLYLFFFTEPFRRASSQSTR